MTPSRRLYILGLSALATALCWRELMRYPLFALEWWLWELLTIYAAQPLVNPLGKAINARWDKWQERRAKSDPLRYFVLTRPSKH